MPIHIGRRQAPLTKRNENHEILIHGGHFKGKPIQNREMSPHSGHHRTTVRPPFLYLPVSKPGLWPLPGRLGLSSAFPLLAMASSYSLGASSVANSSTIHSSSRSRMSSSRMSPLYTPSASRVLGKSSLTSTRNPPCEGHRTNDRLAL